MAANGLVTDKAAVGRFIETAEGYATVAYTSSPDKSAELLLLAAGAAKTVESYGKAVQLYYKISEKMPEHPKAPTALFMQGFIYENDLKDLDKAKAIYESFLKRFPNDADYADDAQMALKNLGKSPEEMIREFEKKAGKK